MAVFIGFGFILGVFYGEGRGLFAAEDLEAALGVYFL
jgi:hypothetical protein